jgi:hypothetical protein
MTKERFFENKYFSLFYSLHAKWSFFAEKGNLLRFFNFHAFYQISWLIEHFKSQE